MKKLRLEIENETTLGDLAEFIHKARKHGLTNKSVLTATSEAITVLLPPITHHFVAPSPYVREAVPSLEKGE